MMTVSSSEVTELLQKWNGGDAQALERLTPVIYDELYRLARGYMNNERRNHILQPTALVHEVYVRLINWKNITWQNRAHFYGVSAQLMRRILVDFARRRPHLKNHELKHVSLEEASVVPAETDADLVALDEALISLAEIDPRKAQIVELRFFGGLSIEEIAAVLRLAPITIMREWNKAKAWLYLELNNN